MFLIINSLLYTIGWYLTIYMASVNLGLWSALPAFVLVIAQLFYLKKKEKKVFYQDVFLLLYALVIGFFMELIFTSFHLIAYKSADHSVPIWILILYPLFALTINHSMRWIQYNVILPPFLGVFAPFIYYAGYKLGACQFPLGIFWMCLITIPCWCLFLYGLVQINKQLERTVETVFEAAKPNHPIQMLYDGECPICSREVGGLQKKCSANLRYVDITDPHYAAQNYQGVDYKTAMQAMHAIDSQNRVLIGVDAFTQIYGALGWRFLPILLQAPLLKPLFALFYKFFAKHRLFFTGRNNP